MKKIKITLLLAAFGIASFAQQDQQFTQFMHNKLTYNPGFAGTNKMICATAIGRKQWMGFDGAPQTIALNIDAPVMYNSPMHGGLGLTVMNDQLGNDRSNFARLAYSYHLPLQGGVGLLGIGIEAGMMQKTLVYNWLPPDGTATITSDNSIPDSKQSATTYDLNFGAYYTTPTMYIGVSASHLPGQTLKKANQFEFKNARHYFLIAGYNWVINSDFTLTPNIKVKSDAVSTIFDAGVNLMWQDMVWIGAAYRMTDAVAVMLGYKNTSSKGNVFKIGLAYDITLSELKNYSNNTPEIMIGYCYKIDIEKKPQSHINPRFLK